MRAVVFDESRVVRLAERPVPVPRPDEVLLQPLMVGICGTDLHAESLDLFRPGVVMGHEFSAEVIGLGAAVTGWKPGDRVSVNPNGNLCNACWSCLHGLGNLCRDAVFQNGIGVHRDGGMADRVCVEARVLHLLPADVSAQQGAWVEPLATAVRAVRLSGFQSGSSALVIGAGAIGLLTVQVLRDAGASTIAVVEPFAFRLKMAAATGANVAVASLDLLPREALADFVFECSGAPSAVRSALQAVRPAGVVMVIGIAPAPLEFGAFDLVAKEAQIRSSLAYTGEFDEAVRLLRAGRVQTETLTTRIVPLEEFRSAMAALRQPDSAVKILLQP